MYTQPTDEDSSSDSDEGDTDEELEKVRAATEKATTAKEKARTNAEKARTATKEKAATSTEKAGTPSKKRLEVGPDGLPLLPDFFEGLRLLVYGHVSESERKELRRLVTAFGGSLVDYMSPSVSHVLSRSPWGTEFTEALEENAKLTFLSPDWVLDCGRRNELLDEAPYLIRKTDSD